MVGSMRFWPGVMLLLITVSSSGSLYAAEDDAWRVGMSAALTGPAEALGNGMRVGVQAYFDQVNQQGGVHGRKLELHALDDAYEPARTAPNMRSFADRGDIFAVIGNVGTPTAAVAVPIANEKKLPFVGAFTGAGLLRQTPPDRYIINYRASYAEETAEMVRGIVSELGIKPEQVGFFTQNDAYGDAGWEGGVQALQALGFTAAEELPHGRYARNTVDVEDALSRLLDPRVDVRAVIMVGAYKPCARFIQLARSHDFHPIFLNVSFVGSEALLDSLGEAGEGVIVTQVVPLPNGTSPVAREFQRTVPPKNRNFVSFEGFIAAKAFVSALERSGPNATPELFIETLESGEPFDLGLGSIHSLSPREHQFSHRVWPTIIRSGRFELLNSWTDVNIEESGNETR